MPEQTDMSWIEWIWYYLNSFLIGIEDAVLSVWPSTPDAIKVSVIVGGLQAAHPNSPWWLLGDLVFSVPLVFGSVALYKLWVAIWP